MVHAIKQPAKPKILVILGSTRKGRICHKVAGWVVDVARDGFAGDFETIDLHDWPLPMDDEPGVPAAGHYENAHTLAWSRKILEGDAFVIVTPQYNWGYPAPLKNALDHLYEEWRGKPVVIVTYGQRGGNKCARQLREVTEGLHMRAVQTMPALKLRRELIEANDGSVAPELDFADDVAHIRQVFSELGAMLAGGMQTEAG